jgi:hypothetical protein
MEFNVKKKYALWILSLLLFSSVATAWYLPAHYYEFEDVTRDNCLLAGCDNASLSPINGPTYATGKIGKAIDCEEGSSQYLINSSYPVPSAIKTIEFWAKPENPTYTNYPRPLQLGDAAAHSYSWDIMATNTQSITSRMRFGGATIWTIASADTWTDGAWTHIIMSKNVSHYNLFINGTLTGSAANTQELDGNFTDFNICRRQDNQAYWDGLVDNVALFEDSYSGKNASDSYNNGAGINFSALPAPPPPPPNGTYNIIKF